MMSQMPPRREDHDLGDPQRRTVLFVCTGNICRSPMAEVAFRSIAAGTALGDGRVLADLVDTESAGTANWHVGSQMDPRARTALDAAGFTGPGTPAAHVSFEQVARSRMVLALDRGHLADLGRIAPHGTPVELLLAFGPARGFLEVADPYYGDDDGFAACLEVIVAACEGLASRLAASSRYS